MTPHGKALEQLALLEASARILNDKTAWDMANELRAKLDMPPLPPLPPPHLTDDDKVELLTKCYPALSLSHSNHALNSFLPKLNPKLKEPPIFSPAQLERGFFLTASLERLPDVDLVELVFR